MLPSPLDRPDEPAVIDMRRVAIAAVIAFPVVITLILGALAVTP